MTGNDLLYFVTLPYALVWLGLFLAMAFGVVFWGMRVLRVPKQEMASAKSRMYLVFFAWGADIIAVLVSLILMSSISKYIPYFDGVHSEWGIAYEHAQLKAILYSFCVLALHAALLLFSYFGFQKTIPDRAKCNKLFRLYLAVSTILLESICMVLSFLL